MENIGLLVFLPASSLVWILWDALMTIDDEVQVIWSQRFSATTALYLLNRYGVAAVQITFQYGASKSRYSYHPAKPRLASDERYVRWIGLEGTKPLSSTIQAVP